MEQNKKLDTKCLNDKKSLFKDTVDIIDKVNPDLANHKSIAALESIMLGIAFNLHKIKSMKDEDVRVRCHKMLEDSALSRETLKGDIAAKEKILHRLNTAKRIFSDS